MTKPLVVLLATAASILTATAASAQDSTWDAVPADDDYNRAVNWTPDTVPVTTAVFGASNITTIRFTAQTTTVGAISLQAGAPAYTFNLQSSTTPPRTFTFTGLGIINNSANAPTINVTGNPLETTQGRVAQLRFSNASRAANAIINVTGGLSNVTFDGTSSADAARIAISGAAVGAQNFGSSLSFAASSTAGSARIEAGNRANISFSGTSSAGAATLIANSGSFLLFDASARAGTANFTLNGANVVFVEASSADGSTMTNNGGTVAFQFNATAGNAFITNNAGGTLIFQDSASATVGTRIVNNAGATTDIAFLTAGIGLTVGSIEGAGAILLGGRRLTLGGDNRSTAIAGVISEGGPSGGIGGGLTKTGTGTLTFSGPNTYTGATNVNAGTLLVNGSLTSAVTVATGARLGGTGSVGATNVSGTLSPGDDGAIGTLTVNGNLVLNAGSNTRIDVGTVAGSSDRIVVTGTASLAGSLMAIASGTSFTAGRYTLLTAAGGRTGTFNPFTSNPNASAVLAYDANNVFLDVAAGATTSFNRSTRESIVFTAPVVATNRVNIFSTQIIGRLLGGQALYDQTFGTAFNSTAVQTGVIAARASITAAGGPGVIIGDPVRTASTTTSVTASATTFSLSSNPVLTNETVVTIGPNTIQTGALSTCNVASLPSTTRPTCQTGGTPFLVVSGSTDVNTITNTVFTVAENRTDTITDTLRETYELNGQVVAVGSVHAEVQSGLFDLGARLLGRLGRVEAGTAGWADVYGFRVNQGGRRSALGIAGGVGIAVAPGLTLVLGIDRGRIDVDVAGALETGRVELTEIGGALRFDTGPFAASLALVQGFGNASTRRTIIGNSSARYDVRVTGVALDLGYAMSMGGWTLRPEAGIEWVRLSTSAFAESDTLGLVVAGGAARQVRATAGLSVNRDFGSFSLIARARYLAVLEGSVRAVPVAFALAPTRPLTMTSPGEPNGVLLGARIGVPVGARASLGFGYDGRLGSGYTSHAATASVRVAF